MNSLNLKAAMVFFLVLCVLGAVAAKLYFNSSSARDIHLEYGSGDATIYLEKHAIVRVVNRSANSYSIEISGSGPGVVNLSFEKGANFPHRLHRVVEEGGVAYLVSYDSRGDVVSRINLAQSFPGAPKNESTHQP